MLYQLQAFLLFLKILQVLRKVFEYFIVKKPLHFNIAQYLLLIKTVSDITEMDDFGRFSLIINMLYDYLNNQILAPCIILFLIILRIKLLIL